ncbi:MAG: chemotaxis response regulator protein-glutamate methylesterase [Spirochaetes bacterium]|jgi:two-component system chemotaxis response regulator CheB|nr:chemotaxis response regulator protein-glutamate methylesterase [Spirochaetota bacterium]
MDEINVMVVDDSALIRQVLFEILDSKTGIRVSIRASNPIIAEKHMEKEWPDVIILDIEMPEKDGLTFLKEIMEKRPTPIIICSGVTEKNATVTIEALSAGAVSIITKPKIGIKDFFYESEQLLVDEVRAAYNSNHALLRKRLQYPNVNRNLVEKKYTADVVLSPPVKKVNVDGMDRIVVIGASSGGTQALESVLTALPTDCPGIAIVQHMPEKFTKAFADRLNSICDIEVKEAEQDDLVCQGRALIARGGKHMSLQKYGQSYRISVIDGPLVSRHRPSVDVLFRSAAKAGGSNILGLILTGMGDDGAAGLLEMKNSGCYTVAQDKESSLVYGMPKVAVERGGALNVISLLLAPDTIMKFANQ